jgi:hypothetical protein
MQDSPELFELVSSILNFHLGIELTVNSGNTVLNWKPGLFSSTHFHAAFSASVLEAA